MRTTYIRANWPWHPSTARACAALLGLLAWQMAASPTPAAATTSTGARTTSSAPASAESSAVAKPDTIKLKPLGSGAPSLDSATRGSLLTDGVRWAAYEPRVGLTRLIDTKTGRSTDRPDPNGCAGGLRALGGGEILYDCANPECPPQESEGCFVKIAPQESEAKGPTYLVEDIATGIQHPLAGEKNFPVSSSEGIYGPGGLDAIGAQWAQGGFETNGGHSFFFVNWHTGAVLREEEEPSSAQEDFEDLNSSHLLQPLCEPLTRPSESPLQARKFGQAAYAPPFAIFASNIYKSDSVPLQLRRCGSQSRILLPGIGPAQLGGGVLSWGGNYVTRLHTRGRAWHGPFYRLGGATGSTSSDSLLQHTSTMAFMTVFTGESKPSHIYVAHLP